MTARTHDEPKQMKSHVCLALEQAVVTRLSRQLSLTVTYSWHTNQVLSLASCKQDLPQMDVQGLPSFFWLELIR